MDIENISQIVGVAGSAAQATGQAVKTLDAIKGLFSSSKSEDNSNQTALLNELTAKLTAANFMNLQISEMLRDLATAFDKSNNFNERLAKYRLFDTGQGVMVYILKQEHAIDMPVHYICPICLEKNGEFHFVTGSEDQYYKSCQACRHSFDFKKFKEPRVNRRGAFS